MDKLRYVEWETHYITAKYPSISNKEFEYIQGSIGYIDELNSGMLNRETHYITAKYPSISNKELEYIQGSIGYTDEQNSGMLGVP